MTVYRHTQIGWVNVILFATAVSVVPLLLSDDSAGATSLIFVLALAAVLMFSFLTVTVDESHVVVRMGIGLIGRRIALADVQSAEPVRNRWWYGWGVRIIPGGIMYSVYGLSAVELTMANGSRFRIGTDDSVALARAIREAGGERLSSASEMAVASGAGRGWIPGAILAAVIVLPPVLVGFVQMQPPVARVSAERVLVRSWPYSVEVPTPAISGLSLDASLPPVERRTNGFSLRGTLRGHFDVRNVGAARLFVDRGYPPYVMIRTPDVVVFVNYKDPERTRRLYDEIARHTGRE